MPRYKFTDAAEADLDTIVDYTLKHWGRTQALKYVDDLEALLQKLATTPALGLNRDQFHPGLRSFPYASHVVYYLKGQDGIAVIRILHKRMDAKKHLPTN